MSDTAVQSSSKATAEASTASSETSVDVAVEAAKLIGVGRRNLLVGDAPGAVQVLQEACALLATKYGETGEELGEAYFHYGSALLELGRMESGVLGNALHGVDPQTDDDDDGDDETVESAEKVQGEERKKVLQDVDDALESIPEKTKDDAPKDAKDGDKKDEKDDEAMETDEKEVKGEQKETKEKKNKDEQEKSKEEKVAQKEQPKDGQMDQKAEQKKENKVEPKDDKVEQKKEDKDEDSKVTKDEDKVKDEKDGSKTAEKKDDGAGPSTADDDGDADEKEDGEADDTAEDTAEGDTADENTEKEEEGEGDDVPNFQLCWEILELARIIFGAKEDKEFKLKVSEVHLKLGELGLETEQYPQSIEDFTQCLNIQKEHLEPESRLLAETHYNLGLAYCSDNKFSDAIDHFEAAKKVIEARITLLEKRVKENEGEGKGKEKADAEDPVVKDRKEIKELQDLLPEISAKLEDAKDSKKTAASAASQAIAAAAAEFGLGAGSSSSTNAFGAPSSSTSQVAKPIQVRKAGGDAPSDISHLVKRKRKSDEGAADSKEADSATSPTDAKRIKPDDKGDAAKTNGHANGTVNGHDKSPDKQEANPKTVEKKVNGNAAPAAAMETS